MESTQWKGAREAARERERGSKGHTEWGIGKIAGDTLCRMENWGEETHVDPSIVLLCLCWSVVKHIKCVMCMVRATIQCEKRLVNWHIRACWTAGNNSQPGHSETQGNYDFLLVS